MKNWSLGMRIGAAFSGTLLVVLALAVVVIAEFGLIGQSARFISQKGIPDAIALLQTQQLVAENFGLAQAYLHAPDRQAVASRVMGNVGKIDKLISAYEATLTSDSERNSYAEFKKVRNDWVLSFKQLMAMVKDGRQEEAGTWTGTVVLARYMTVDAKLTTMSKLHLGELNRADEAVLEQVHEGTRNTWIGSVAALLVAASVGTVVSLSTRKLLRSAADSLILGSKETVTAAAQVSAAAASLANGASEQASALEETSASMEEMESVTRSNSDHTRNARSIAGEARIVAESGGREAEKLAGAMSELKISSGEVAKIVKTIDEIAFQTNILALNAAVEAARAGVAGAGFAVVAEEVRGLAQRSAQAARETADKIHAAVTRSEEGVRISDGVTTNLKTIAEKVRALDELLDALARSASEQTEGIGQINTAVGQVDKVTQANAASAEEAAAAAAELNHQAQSLNGLVGDLMIIAGGRRSKDGEGLPGPSQQGGNRRHDQPVAAGPRQRFKPELAPALS